MRTSYSGRSKQSQPAEGGSVIAGARDGAARRWGQGDPSRSRGTGSPYLVGEGEGAWDKGHQSPKTAGGFLWKPGGVRPHLARKLIWSKDNWLASWTQKTSQCRDKWWISVTITENEPNTWQDKLMPLFHAQMFAKAPIMCWGGVHLKGAPVSCHVHPFQWPRKATAIGEGHTPFTEPSTSPLPAPQGHHSGEALLGPWATFEHHSSCCVREHWLLMRSQPWLSGHQLQKTKGRGTTPAGGQGDFQETRDVVFFSW